MNRGILAKTGTDKGALVTVTASSAAVAMIITASMTNSPSALAPGMGIKTFPTFMICLTCEVWWRYCRQPGHYVSHGNFTSPPCGPLSRGCVDFFRILPLKWV
ncbi:MAG: hypothetical protein EXS39_01110 [Opitutaceae bacterium]|nr:hypothetical protein [Opitutaceae bacterium]